MSLLDLLTGGKASDAEDAARRAENAMAGVQTPSVAELTLPELEKYVQAGVLTPAQAQAALMQGNAFDGINVAPGSREAQMAALNKLQDISGSEGMDAQSRAALAEAMDKVQTQEHGAQGSILDQFAQRGIPTSLMAGAMQSANAGQEAQSANLAATQTAGDAEQRALQALSESGNLAGQIHGQEYNEQAAKAQAANAINQWNAGNQTNVNLANQQTQQRANEYNTQTAQNVSNENVRNANARTEYNTQVPETVFQNQLSKATGQAGAAQNTANLEQQQGQQQAGFYGGLLGAGATAGGDYLQGKAMGDAIMAAHGAVVPGHPEVPGDSSRNDKVPAMLSPGELVVPRTIAPHPEEVKDFVSHLMRHRRPVSPAHPDDIHSIMQALSRRREEAA